jgi:hypothetical protein
VLTTGSALTFDGTNLSVGGSNSQQRLNVVVPVFTTNASGGMRIGDSGNNYYVDQLVTTDGSANPFWDVKFATHTLSRYAYGGGNNFWAWYANNAEGMRLTSTGLGVGTSSPATRLDVNGDITQRNGSGITIGKIENASGWYSLTGDSANVNGAQMSHSTTLRFVTASTERMRITSAGDVGIGTSSPSTYGKLAVVGAATTEGYTVNTATTGQASWWTQNNGGARTGVFTYGSAQTAYGSVGSGEGAFYSGANLTIMSDAGAGVIKFATGGNTEKMRLDAAGNLGLGVTPSAFGAGRWMQFLSVSAVGQQQNGTANLACNAYESSANSFNYILSAAAARYNVTAGAHQWYTAPSGTAGNAISFTQAMTLDASGNLGVGATSPGTNLHIGTGSSPENLGVTLSRGATTNFYLAHDGTKTFIAGIDPTLDGPKVGSLNSYPLLFVTGNSERARITSGGNFGIGVSAPSTRLDIGGGQVLSFGAVEYGLTGNFGYPGISGGAGNLLFANKNYGAAAVGLGFVNSGTYEASLTVRTSGNVGIGTASPNSRLEVDTNTAATSTVLALTNSANWGWDTYLDFRKPLTNGGAVGLAGRISSLYESSNNYALAFGTTNSGTNSERARITSTGALLVGTTDGSQNGGDGNKLIAGGAVWVINAGSNDGFSYYNSSAAAYRFYVSANGTISATNTTISAISDQRLKENVQDLDAGLDKIMALKPRKFDWKTGKGKDIKGDRGFIAQEFEQVFPDLIDEWKDPAPEGEEPYKSVRQDLIPVLVKAIQELKAQNDDLRARVAQLENLKGN